MNYTNPHLGGRKPPSIGALEGPTIRPQGIYFQYLKEYY
jgi:hypothetical protein